GDGGLIGPTYSENPDFVNLAPFVVSITRTPQAQFTNSTSVVYTVTFNEPVTGVDATDFKVLADATLKFDAALAVAGSGATYTVTINNLVGTGSLQLELIDNDSIMANGFPLRSGDVTNGSFASEPFTVSLGATRIAPTILSIVRVDPTQQSTTATTLTFLATF